MDGIIFDLDGTLWDTTEVSTKAWNHLLKTKTTVDRQIAVEELKATFGKLMDEIVEILLPKLDEKEREKICEMFCEYENEYMKSGDYILYEGMLEGIKKLSEKFPLFIVSNCQAGYIETFLEETNLHNYITDHTCPGDTGMAKADNIRLIMERNQLDKVVYVGDTAGDEAACQEARVPMIHVAYGFGSAKNPWKTVQSFGELLDIDFGEIDELEL